MKQVTTCKLKWVIGITSWETGRGNMIMTFYWLEWM